MQFLILAHDYTDAEALSRRMAHREAHLAVIAEYKAKGHMLLGAALKSEAGKMIGSVIVADFPDRASLHTWLDNDPYVTGKVWEKVTVQECALAPSFMHLLNK